MKPLMENLNVALFFPIETQVRRKTGVIAYSQVTHRLKARVRLQLVPVRMPIKTQIAEESGNETN